MKSKQTKKDEPIVHVRLGYEEALFAKKDVLNSEASMLKLIQAIKAYNALRQEELKTKAAFKRKLKETDNSIKKLKQTLPKLKLPKILQEEKEEDHEEKIEEIKTEEDIALEKQLAEIQHKLRELGA